ncbi:MAG: hypothetical protein ACPG7F_10615 [Aggregatilineales bacterium]
MQVRINNKKIQLANNAVIGIGGEATVFKAGNQAVKIYLAPDKQRADKLQAMLPAAQKLPSDVIAPQALVHDEKSRAVIGFTMNLLDAGFTEIRELAKKKYRAQTGLTTRDIAQLFMSAGATLQQIHQAGMIVGDLNDLNIMFRDDTVRYIDTDSFQFSTYPCMVGTEAFIDPDLYGKNLATRPFFKTSHDWYSFMVLLFKSLLMTHPYGGVHKRIKLLPQRAMQGISVFHRDVTYPRIAFSPDLLSDDLSHEFVQWFEQGKRDGFNLSILQHYISELGECLQCGASYPRNRAQCPVCAAIAPAPVSQQMRGAKTLLRTDGDIIAWHIETGGAKIIAHENGKAVLYIIKGQSRTKRLELFNAMAAAQYAFLNDILVISPDPDNDELLLVDVSGTEIQPLMKSSTGRFGQGSRIFAAGRDALYRIANGYLMRGQFRYGQLVEDAVMSVVDSQTWFSVSPDSDRVFGYFRSLNRYDFWFLHNGQRIDMPLTSLEQFEFLLDISVKFSNGQLLVMRQTQLNGVERMRVDELTEDGTQLQSLISTDTQRYLPIDAHTYAPDMLLVATDDGILRETLDSRAETHFRGTEQFVYAGNRLYPYEKGLLILTENRVLYVTV